MKFFLDSANLAEIREAAELGLIDGVTTNPSLISKEGGVDFKKHIAAVCEVVAGDVSAEVTSLDAEGMLRDVRVTFSATERVRRLRGAGGGAPSPLEGDTEPPTRGLDLLLIPSFRELFSGDAPADDESLRVGRVAILFTDLRGSTALYQERGDPRAYHLVRDHFAILGERIDRNRGSLVKTIGDAVMASFASGADAVRAALESQAELRAHAGELGEELVLKAGVHAGACLAVRLNGRLDFFGGSVNVAARMQGLSRGRDVVVSDAVLADIKAEAWTSTKRPRVAESFDAELRGISAPVSVHRLVTT